MQLLKLLVVACFAALAAGCNSELKGRIVVNEPLKFNVAKGASEVPPGNYNLKIDFPKKHKVRFEIKLSKKSKLRAQFDIGSRYFPKYNGPIEVPASENGQPYDLVGFLETTESESRERWSTESCTYTDYYRECFIDRDGRRHCRTVPVTVNGYRDIRYYDRTTHQRLELDLEIPRTKRAVAQTGGSHTWHERIYTYQGHCR